VTLAGGRGSMAGVLGGVLAIGLLEDVFTLNGVGVDPQEVVKGVPASRDSSWWSGRRRLWRDGRGRMMSRGLPRKMDR